MNMKIKELLEAASADTGVVVDYDEVLLPMIEAGNIILASEDGEYVGFLAFIPFTEPATKELYWFERMAWVAPEHRGKGVGKELLDAWQIEAEEAGVDVLQAGSSLGSPAAEPLYKSAGFQVAHSFRKVLKNV